jgi:hypothetical protein
VLRTFVLTFAFALVAFAAEAQQVDKLEVIEFGVYERGPVTDVRPATANAFGRVAINGIKHLRTTRKVPGRIGVTFGFRYRTIGKPHAAVVPAVEALLLPPGGTKSPVGRQPFTRDVSSTALSVGGEGRALMTFDEPWEIVPGIWTVQIWEGKRKLLEQSFEVYLPPIS